MILHHFNPAYPHRHWLLAIPSLALAIVDREIDGIVLVDRPNCPLPDPATLGDMREAYELATRSQAPARTVDGSALVMAEWLYFTDAAGKHHFILHNTAPVFLCPFKPAGDDYEILNPVADDGTLDDSRLDAWLDLAATAAKRALLDLARRLGVAC